MDTNKENRINELAGKLLLNPKDKKSSSELKDILGFDDAHLHYFISLFSKYKSSKDKEFVIADHKDNKEDGTVDIVYSTAVASEELLKELPCTQYSDIIKDKSYAQHASKVRLWLKKMQAGTGSSLERTEYLSDIKSVAKDKVKLGSKGTDLFINYRGESISLAEAQILQAISDAKRKTYEEIILHDIVSAETKQAVEGIWGKNSTLDSSKSYVDLISETQGIERFKDTVQLYQPTVDESGKLSTNRLSPGGHGFIAVDAMLASSSKDSLPGGDFKNLIGVIGNGEDLGSTPDESIIGWMAKENIPIAMLTTDKTELDMKGGQIALVKDKEGFTYITIIEKAQAEAFGKLELFEKMGLRKEDNKSFFNTNIAIINYDVMCPFIQNMLKEKDLEILLSAITPDLIKNTKKQKDTDGISRNYVQMEGAMGSSILNLDKFWRKHYGKALVHILNIDGQHRTRFFSPIKSSFDFFIQFFTDRFKMDESRVRLEDMRAGCLPHIELDKYYADIKNVINSFEGSSMLDLDSLRIKGKVTMKNFILKGDVEIVNETDKLFDLADLFQPGQRILENVSLHIGKDADININKKGC